MDQATTARPALWTAPTRKPAGRFDLVSIGLHWLTVLLVAGQFTAALLVDQLPEMATSMLTVHRSMGVATWLVVAGRVVWRRRFARPPPFPPSMPAWQRRAATANELGLYALLLLQPLTGLGDTLLRGRPFQLWLWRVPALMARDKPMSHALHSAHELGAVALAALIGLHVAAAIFHGVLRRDGVLQRMTP